MTAKTNSNIAINFHYQKTSVDREREREGNMNVQSRYKLKFGKSLTASGDDGSSFLFNLYFERWEEGRLWNLSGFYASQLGNKCFFSRKPPRFPENHLKFKEIVVNLR